MKSNIPISFKLRALVLVALITAFLQVSLGGFVRVSESGLGCPDWPLCHGELIPPFEYHTMIEYSHRLTGTVLGIFVLLIVGIVLFQYHVTAREMLKFGESHKSAYLAKWPFPSGPVREGGLAGPIA